MTFPIYQHLIRLNINSFQDLTDFSKPLRGQLEPSVFSACLKALRVLGEFILESSVSGGFLSDVFFVFGQEVFCVKTLLLLLLLLLTLRKGFHLGCGRQDSNKNSHKYKSIIRISIQIVSQWSDLSSDYWFVGSCTRNEPKNYNEVI